MSQEEGRGCLLQIYDRHDVISTSILSDLTHVASFGPTEATDAVIQTMYTPGGKGTVHVSITVHGCAKIWIGDELVYDRWSVDDRHPPLETTIAFTDTSTVKLIAFYCKRDITQTSTLLSVEDLDGRFSVPEEVDQHSYGNFIRPCVFRREIDIFDRFQCHSDATFASAVHVSDAMQVEGPVSGKGLHLFDDTHHGEVGSIIGSADHGMGLTSASGTFDFSAQGDHFALRCHTTSGPSLQITYDEAHSGFALDTQGTGFALRNDGKEVFCVEDNPNPNGTPVLQVATLHAQEVLVQSVRTSSLDLQAASETDVSAAMLCLTGLNDSLSGPHITTRTFVDDVPLLQFASWKHDKIAINFDCGHSTNEVSPLTRFEGTSCRLVKENGFFSLQGSSLTDPTPINIISTDLETKVTRFSSGVVFSDSACLSPQSDGNSFLYFLKDEGLRTSFRRDGWKLGALGDTFGLFTAHVTNEPVFLVSENDLSVQFLSTAEQSVVVAGGIQIHGNTLTSTLQVSDEVTTRTLFVESTEDALGDGSGSIVTAGGLHVARSLLVNGTITSSKILVDSDIPQVVLASVKRIGALPSSGSHILSEGARVVLAEAYTNETCALAIGVGPEQRSIWYGVSEPSPDSAHNWFAGESCIMSLNGLGDLTLARSLTIPDALSVGEYTCRQNSDGRFTLLFSEHETLSVSSSGHVKVTELDVTLVCAQTVDVETSLHLGRLTFDHKGINHATASVLAIEEDSVEISPVGKGLLRLNCQTGTGDTMIGFGSTGNILLYNGENALVRVHHTGVDVKGQVLGEEVDLTGRLTAQCIIAKNEIQGQDGCFETLHAQALQLSNIAGAPQGIYTEACGTLTFTQGKVSLSTPGHVALNGTHVETPELRCTGKFTRISALGCSAQHDSAPRVYVHVDHTLGLFDCMTWLSVCQIPWRRETQTVSVTLRLGEFSMDVTVTITPAESGVVGSYATAGCLNTSSGKVSVFETFPERGHHVFLLVPPLTSAQVTVDADLIPLTGAESLVNLTTEGSAHVPDGTASRWNSQWRLVYVTDGAPSRFYGVGDLDVNGKLFTSGQIEVGGSVCAKSVKVSNELITNRITSDGEALTISNGRVADALRLDETRVHFQLSLQAATSGLDIGSQSCPWKDVYANSLMIREVQAEKISVCEKVTAASLQARDLTLSGTVKAVVVNTGSLTVSGDTIVQNSLTVLDLGVAGTATFSENIQVLGRVNSAEIVCGSLKCDTIVPQHVLRLSAPKLIVGSPTETSQVELSLAAQEGTLIGGVSRFTLGLVADEDKLIFEGNGNVRLPGGGELRVEKQSILLGGETAIGGDIHVNGRAFVQDIQFKPFLPNIGVCASPGWKESTILRVFQGCLQLCVPGDYAGFLDGESDPTPKLSITPAGTVDVPFDFSVRGHSCLESVRCTMQEVEGSLHVGVRQDESVGACVTISKSSDVESHLLLKNVDATTLGGVTLENDILRISLSQQDGTTHPTLFELSTEGICRLHRGDKLDPVHLEVSGNVEGRELISLGGVLLQSAIRFHHRNGKESASVLVNDNGLRITAAGQVGFTVSPTSGNVRFDGIVYVDSPLDSGINGNTAALTLRGGVFAGGSLGTRVGLKLFDASSQHQITIRAPNVLQESITYTLPDTLPPTKADSQFVLVCDSTGRLTWSEEACSCKHIPSVSASGAPMVTEITAVVEGSAPGPEADAQNSEEKVTHGRVHIGASSTSSLSTLVVFENPLPSVDYTIVGNVTYTLDEDVEEGEPNLFVCSFRNLKRTSCMVNVSSLSQKHWENPSLMLHYIIVRAS